MFAAYRKFGSLDKINTYLDRVFDANIEILEEVLAVSSATVRDVIYRHFEKDGTMDRIRGEAKRETALEMLNRGFQAKEVAEIVKMPLDWVQCLKK